MEYYMHGNNMSNTCESFSGPMKDKKNKKKKTKAVKLSTDPQSVAARQRRHRISDRFKILQSLVPGGTKMDTVSMLDEAINYVKFLKTQVFIHQAIVNFVDHEPLVLNSVPVGPQHQALAFQNQLGPGRVQETGQFGFPGYYGF